MATLSDAQLGQIADNIFVMGDRATTRLHKPATTGPPAFTAALNPIATQPEFTDAGIGVIDFTGSPGNFMHPNVWLNNGDKPFRIGSASKIAMMLAAVQLRLDVRKILGMKPAIVSAADLDGVFRDPRLWSKAKARDAEIQHIAGAANAPQISDIFDFAKDPVDFKAPPGKLVDSPDQTEIVGKLPADHDLPWENWSKFTFSERYWLTGCLSDNVAATSCVSQIGVPYIKAVQRSYGLADHPDGGMHLLASGGYTGIGRSGPHEPPRPRQLTWVERTPTSDILFDPYTHALEPRSTQPGSAAALMAYMIALMTDAFADPGTGVVAGLDACQTIRNNLADGGPNAIESFLVNFGVKAVPNTTISRQINKIGILRKADGAKSPLVCEFVYLETKQVPAPPPPQREVMKYAVVTAGLIDDTSPGPNAAQKSADLGAAVHKALLSLP